MNTTNQSKNPAKLHAKQETGEDKAPCVSTCPTCGAFGIPVAVRKAGFYWQDRANELRNQRDELLAAAKEARMALTLDYHGCTKRNRALCAVSPAASQAYSKLTRVLDAIANAEGV